MVQRKIKRRHQTLTNRILLVMDYLPGDLKAAGCLEFSEEGEICAAFKHDIMLE
jgi:hypothetical protein